MAKMFDTEQKNTFAVIHSYSSYDTRQAWVSKEKNDKFKYPVVHTLNNEGVGLVFSNTKDKGHFGQPKVLLTFGEFQYPVNDYKGQFGMSQIIFGLPISSKEEGDKIVQAINSDSFKEVLKYTKWNIFNTEWRMFNYMRRDFWKLL
jgi:hypothetical protein